MTLQTERQHFRGVVCLHCTAPIPVPAIVGAYENTLRGEEQAESSQANSRVFTLRCSNCLKEKPYRTREIVDFEGSPEMNVPFARPTYVRLPLQSEQAKTAKA
jgi:hypothetical protein